MPAAVAAVTPCRRALDHTTVGGLKAHLRGCIQEQIRRGLAVRHVTCGKQKVEGSREPRRLQADPDSIGGGGGCHAFRSAQPSERMGRAAWHVGPCAQAPQRCHRDGSAEIRGQLAIGRHFDGGKHVGGSAPKKWRCTSSGVIGMPARVISSAATAATICSLSTSTPLQSKMSTRTPSQRPAGPTLVLHGRRIAAQDRNRALMAKIWPGSADCTGRWICD
jgi:hypothetical protein